MALSEDKATLVAALSHAVATHLAAATRPATLPLRENLEDLGLDSIGAVQLADQLQVQFGLGIHSDELFTMSLETIVAHLEGRSAVSRVEERQAASSTRSDTLRQPELNGQPSPEDTDRKVSSTVMIETPELRSDIPPEPSDTGGRNSVSSSLLDALNPLEALAQSNSVYAAAAKSHGFENYWETVATLQDDIVVAYFTEALASLGCDLAEQPNGVEVPPVPHLSKYDRLLKRLWDLLERRYIVQQRKGKVLRGSDRIDVAPSEQLVRQLRTDHPQYECEAKLLELVGPSLADCLSGKTDPIKVLFGNAASRDVMATFYATSPMMATHMEQVLAFFHSIVHGAARRSPLRILEVGAGTGGTTARLVDALAEWMAADETISVEYTFTDIGSSFVSKARQRWKETPCMAGFSVFDIEEEVPAALRGRFDIVLGANVVHATHDRTATCQRLRQTLKPHGILVLSEVTKEIPWYDICFGLLDGWWLSDGGKGYAIQSEDVWMNVFKRAGFESTGCSGGKSKEAITQQLLVAQKLGW